MPSVAERVDQNGFAIIDDVISSNTVRQLLSAFAQLPVTQDTKKRSNQPFGIRNLQNLLPEVRELAGQDSIRTILQQILGEDFRLIQCLYFDKTADANWKVSWHQDLTIPVKHRKDEPGFGPWSVKAGISHVQPPTWILEHSVSLRIHLDDNNESNGPLKVILRSHRHGRLNQEGISKAVTNTSPAVCCASSGSIVAMRPLLLHSSSIAPEPGHRRVIHLQFINCALPDGLEWLD
jgi:ectoine hydroxylase-related dioxygenase (phytanoyl-CoA dioxygenase family)